jgi:hypothetical protein
MLGRRAVLWLLGVRSDVGATLETREVPPSARVPVIAAYQDHDALDAVAGCEYVDDRLRYESDNA